MRNIAYRLGWYWLMDLLDAYGERIKTAAVAVVLLILLIAGLWLIAGLGHGG